jgi:hypothetical protein
MSEMKSLKKLVESPTETVDINYYRFKGSGPVSDRDLVVVERTFFEGNKFYLTSCSCDYPFAEVNGVVRAECYIGGYIAEQVDAKNIKVTYISDGDVKGSIPGFLKNMLSQGQGEIASRVDGCLKQLRAKKGK